MHLVCWNFLLSPAKQHFCCLTESHYCTGIIRKLISGKNVANLFCLMEWHCGSNPKVHLQEDFANLFCLMEWHCGSNPEVDLRKNFAKWVLSDGVTRWTPEVDLEEVLQMCLVWYFFFMHLYCMYFPNLHYICIQYYVLKMLQHVLLCNNIVNLHFNDLIK